MLQAESVYHIYNRANGDENLFREKKNYYHFLNQYAKYIYPIAETFAWCLMPNHFHLMIRIRKEEEMQKVFSSQLNPAGFGNLSGSISQQFSNLFNSYTKAINKAYNRHGSLFQRPFKYKEVTNDAYFTQLVMYIHNNAVKHGFVNQLQDWPYSSYHQYLASSYPLPPDLTGFGNLSGLVAAAEVLKWFGGLKHFKLSHGGVGKIQSVFE